MFHHILSSPFWLWWDLFNIAIYVALMLGWGQFRTMRAIVSYAGWGNVRRRGNRLQTALVTYEHPATRRRVVCVGMIHWGESSYFHELQERIDEFESQGYMILYERVRPPTKKERYQLTPQERTLVAQRRKIRTITRKELSSLGLIYQMDRVRYRASWINTDMPLITMLRSLPFLIEMPTTEETFWADRRLYRRWMDIQLNFLLGGIGLASFLVPLIPWRGRLRQMFDIILHQRNDIAMEGVRAHVTKSDIVTMWGAGHLWGIGKQLRIDGFREVNCEWITCYHVRNFGWWESTQLTIQVYWSALRKLWSPA